MLDGLQNKLGPLPVWAWGGLGAAGLFFIMARNKGASPPTPNNMPSASDQSAAMGSAQLANIWQLASDQNAQLQSISNTQNQNQITNTGVAQNYYESLRNLLYGIGAPIYPSGVLDPNHPATYPQPFTFNPAIWDMVYGQGYPASSIYPGYVPNPPNSGGVQVPAPLPTGSWRPGVLDTSQLSPTMNSAATPNALGSWYNGAPNPYSSMYGFSAN